MKYNSRSNEDLLIEYAIKNFGSFDDYHALTNDELKAIEKTTGFALFVLKHRLIELKNSILDLFL